MSVVSSFGRTAALAALGAVLLGGCGGTTTVTANQTEVCNQLVGLQAALNPMLLATNPTGTVGQALDNATKFQAQLLKVRASGNSSQQLLMDRLTRAVNDYVAALKTLPAETGLNTQINSLDSYQQNVMYEYRSLLSRVGCSSVPSMAPVPTPPPPAPVEESPSDESGDSGDGDSGNGSA